MSKKSLSKKISLALVFTTAMGVGMAFAQGDGQATPIVKDLTVSNYTSLEKQDIALTGKKGSTVVAVKANNKLTMIGGSIVGADANIIPVYMENGKIVDPENDDAVFNNPTFQEGSHIKAEGNVFLDKTPVKLGGGQS